MRTQRTLLGALVAVVDRRTSDAEQAATQMLVSLGHRGAREWMTTIARSGFVATLGCRSHAEIYRAYHQSEKCTLAVDGSFYGQEDTAGFELKNLKDSTPVRTSVSRIMRCPGGFATLVVKGSALYAFRDPNGLKPLYIGRLGEQVALASERKALWRIGMKQTDRILPGFLYQVKPGKIGMTRLYRWKMPAARKMPLETAGRHLRTLLEQSSQRIVERIPGLGVAFSGGVDSAVTARLASKFLQDISLFSVGLSAAGELAEVQYYADLLGLPVTTERYDEADLEEHVRRVIWLIEEPNLMKVSVAVPLYWTAMLAARNGVNVLLCGQGSDELFGGYAKFARILDLQGRAALARELFRSVLDSYQVNYERDDQATSPSGIELRTPFANLRVIDFSLRIPTEFKVEPGNDAVRKHILRRVAAQIGLPKEIVWRRKKAIQHGTGVEGAIRRLASRSGLRVADYLAKVHGEVITMERMP